MCPQYHHDAGNHAQILAAAEEDHEFVLELTSALVRVPSRAGIDSYDPIVDVLSRWMREHALPVELVRAGHGAVVGLTVEIRGA